MTVVGSVPHSPESMTTSTTWSSSSLTVQPSVIGSFSPGSIRVRRQQRLAELGEQGLHDRVVGDAHARRCASWGAAAAAAPRASPAG